MLNCELVKINDKSGLIHDGILFPGRNKNIGIIYIHGSLQNFYSIGFLRAMASTYQTAGLPFLSFNLTCHDAISEGEFTDGRVEYVGASVSSFETCLNDIDAAVRFFSDWCDKIVLLGHSLGCDRVVYHLLTRKSLNVVGAILLSPCDSYNLQLHYLDGLPPEKQARLLESNGQNESCFNLLPANSYGVKEGCTWSYPIPISKKALLSIINGPPFYLFNLAKPKKYLITMPSLAVIGGKDALTAADRTDMFRYLSDRFTDFKTATDAASDHSFFGRENWLAKKTLKWIKETYL